MASREKNISAYRKMLTIRTAEEIISEDFKKNRIFSFYHSSSGQEAVAVGVCEALLHEDRVYGNHRSHGHYLAKGGDLYRMFCEIYGKADGCCGGYGGSMHMLDRSVSFMGTTPILGSIPAIANGSAFEQKYNNSHNITVVFLGDGASEEGVFYESVNLAAVMKLPILFVIEDNLYAVNTPESARRSPLFSRKMVYEGLGARFLDCDGNDFQSVHWQTSMLVTALRRGKGPAVLHARCYRQMAHSGPITDESVREKDTKEVRDSDDCIKNMEEHVDTETREAIRAEVKLEVLRAWAVAKTAAEPEVVR